MFVLSHFKYLVVLQQCVHGIQWSEPQRIPRIQIGEALSDDTSDDFQQHGSKGLAYQFQFPLQQSERCKEEPIAMISRVCVNEENV